MPTAMDMNDRNAAGASGESSNSTMTTPNNEIESTDTKPGMIAEEKNLYESKPDNRGRTTWVDTFPDDLENAAENAESARYARGYRLHGM